MSQPRQPHPLLATGRRYKVLAALVVALGLAMPLLIGPAGLGFAALCAMVGAYLGWNGRVLSMAGIAMPIVAETSKHITKGNLDEAQRVADSIPESIRHRPMIARTNATQRALIALARGDAAEAEARATESIAIPPGHFSSEWDGVQRADARSIRALARAALGNAKGVNEDVEAVAASTHALTSSVARAELARAALLARDADKTALGAHLVKHGSAILEHSMPRERSLVRALRSLARTPARSVYREPARPTDEASEEMRMRSWIATIAPDAAAHAPHVAPPTTQEHPAPQADPAALEEIAKARSAAAIPKRNRPLRILAIWLLLIVLFLAIWQLLAVSPPPDGTPPPPADDTTLILLVLPVLGGAAIAGWLAWWMRRYRRLQRSVLNAERALMRGDVEAGTKELRAVAAREKIPALAASARAHLAALANKQAEFARAIPESDAGLALCNRHPTTRALTADIVIPDLIAERAVALAALERSAEAETELAHLTTSFPTYVRLEAALFRVRLVSAVRRGDRATAAEIARMRRPELPLDLRIDLLADLALAASDPAMSTEERERISSELRALPEIETWIASIAPDLANEHARKRT